MSAPTTKTTADIRAGLIRDLNSLRAGNISISEARTRAYLAKNIIDTVKIEIVAAQMNMDRFSAIGLGVTETITLSAAE